MGNSIIKLLYVEDHPVMITGFREIFRSTRDSICLAASAGSVQEAMAIIRVDQFDIIILDLFLHDADPMANIRQLSSCFLDKPVIIYSSHTGVALMKEAFQLGIRAWIIKSSDKKNIKEIITRVHRGETIYPMELQRYHEGIKPDNPKKQEHMKNLDPDEEQLAILAWLCEGYTTQEIATKHLNLTLSTVEKKLQVMRELAEVKTNCGLVALYMKHYAQ